MRWNERVVLRSSFLIGALAVLLGAVNGCGGGKGTVSGKVTLDGKPLPAGKIGFVPSKGVGASGEIKDGQYSVSGVPAGDMKVTVETKSIKSKIDELSSAVRLSVRSSQPPPGVKMPEGAKKALEEERKRDEEMKQELKELRAAYRQIPEKYSKADSSGLTLKVKGGTNNFDVSLSSK